MVYIKKQKISLPDNYDISYVNSDLYKKKISLRKSMISNEYYKKILQLKVKISNYIYL